MPRVRIVANGVPFIVEGEGTPEQLSGALKARLEADPSLLDKRRQQLGLTEDEAVNLLQGYQPVQDKGQFAAQLSDPSEGMSSTDKFLVGAGRTFTELGRGVKMMFTGDETDAEIRKREANEQRLFAKLDDQGIGPEDLGQLAPDAVAFLGSGGLTSMFVRGAALGAARPTTSEDGGVGERARTGMLSGLLSVVGPGSVKTVGALFNLKKTLGKGMMESIRSLNSRGNVAEGLANVIDDGAALTTNGNPAIREVGEAALARASDVVQRMNTFGKQNTVKKLVTNALKRSTREVDGRNVLDMNSFTRELGGISDATLKQGAGKDFGRMLGELRRTFTEISRIADLDGETAEGVLRAITTDSRAAALAKTLATVKEPQAKATIVRQLLQLAASAPQAAAAAPGPTAADRTTEFASQLLQGGQ